MLLVRNQGDLLRKSMERFIGTAVGSLLAMAVLVVDDSIVPEAKGWYAREEFYLTMIGTVTMVRLSHGITTEGGGTCLGSNSSRKG